jgi:proton glutamate symport protein
MKKIFNLFILISLILGILGGIFLPEIMKHLSFLGTIYINLLKFIIVPVIFTSIIVTAFASRKEQSHILIKSVLIFTIMFIITFLLTSLIVWLINPAKGVTFDIVDWNGEIANLSFSEIITNLFPSNIVTMISGNSIFACIILAFAMGIAASKVENGSKLIELMETLKNIFNKLLEWIMYLTPIGVFSLVRKCYCKLWC